MNRPKRTNRKTGYRILAVFLALLLVIGTVAALYANIRFSRLKYVEDTARYAADLTGEYTAYLTEDRLTRAWKILRTTVRKPKNAEEYELYAQIAIAREDFDGAAAYLQGCIDTGEGSESDLAILHLRLGSLHILREDPENAMSELCEAIRLDKTLAAAYYLRAQLYAEAEETEKALDDYRTYITMHGSDPAVKVLLAPVFEAAGEMENAELCLTAGIEYGDPADPQLYADRGRCRVGNGNLAGAKEDLEQYFRLGGTDPNGEAAALLGMCRMEYGAYGEAVEMFAKALEDGYADTALLYEQSMMCRYAEEAYALAAEDGEKAAEAAKESGKDTAEIHFWTGMSYLALGQYADAGIHLTEAAKSAPDLESIHYYLGVCAMANEEDEMAAAEFTASIDKNESVQASLYNRAVCYIRLEKYEEAQADLLKAAEGTEDPELSADADGLLSELQSELAKLSEEGF